MVCFQLISSSQNPMIPFQTMIIQYSPIYGHVENFGQIQALFAIIWSKKSKKNFETNHKWLFTHKLEKIKTNFIIKIKKVRLLYCTYFFTEFINVYFKFVSSIFEIHSHVFYLFDCSLFNKEITIFNSFLGEQVKIEDMRLHFVVKPLKNKLKFRY